MNSLFSLHSLRRMQRHPMALLGLLATVWLACGAPEAQAADFAGASQVVVRVMAAIAAPAAAAVPTDDGKMVALANDLAGLRAGWTNMTPDAAAARWLSLADRLYELQSADPNNPFRASIMHDWDEYVMAGEIAGGSTGTVTLVTLLDSLPGPPAWSALRAQIESRSATTPAEQKRNLTLMLMANLLLDDRAGFDAVIKDGDARFRKIGDRSVSDVKSVLEHLRRAAVQRNLRTPADAVNAFRQVIDLPLDPEAGAVDVQVPDLVGIAGEKEARILLNKAIRVPYLKFRVPGGGSTLSLLKEVVAADIASLQRPQWALINSSADVSLFEAMDRKFPARSADEDSEDVMSMVTDGGRYGRGEQDYERRGALGYYLLALIEAGRIDDAVSATLKAAEAEGFELNLNLDVRSLTDSNAVSRLAQYCEGVLVKRSVESLWPVYTAVANRAGCGEAALKLLRQSMADPTAGPESLVRLQRHYLAALLAMDRVDEAAAFCREAIKTRKPGVRERAYESAQIPLRLAQLGRLLGRKDWVSEGVAAMLQSDPAGSNQGMVGFRYMYDDETLLAFKEAGRLADIEALAVEALAMGLRESQQNIDMMEAVQILGPLAAVYDAAGRPADVMALLEHAPWWGVEDVCELVSQDSLQMPVLHALVATDRTRDAARFARLILVTKPDDDNVYSVLVDVEGINCLPFLEDLSQRDRFQERPLIWKAEVLRRTGQLDAAEAAARAALQIDPTDGEQHAGDRVRVYSVLAAILEAGGKKSDAAFFSNVVESVRMAEEGDRFTEMGLLERSLPLYEQAEVLFGAAYCVQWRLAERLQAMGRTAEAEMHYAIAFERMPEQFGRVASFCFGCEGAFRSGASRSAAERVLSGLLDKEPVRPQVYYLMGLLREAQDRKSEAADYFKKALEKDPEYFDAMRALLNLASVVFMTQDERNSLMLRMLALDPLQRHGTYIKEISDFKALWDRVGQAQRLRLKPETGIFPLAASKAHLAAQADAMRQQVQASGLPVNVYIGMSRRSMAMERSGMFTVPTFGETLMGHELMSKIVPLLQPSGNNGIY